MAAKRKSRISPKARIQVDLTDVEAGPNTPIEVPGSPPAEPGGERTGKPTVPKGGPTPRGGIRSGGVGRGQGAPQARRYAFRRS